MNDLKVVVGRKYIDCFSKEVITVKERLMDNYFKVEGNGWERNTSKTFLRSLCGCTSCQEGLIHQSDCLVHNEPAEENGECNCNPSYLKNAVIIEEMGL